MKSMLRITLLLLLFCLRHTVQSEVVPYPRVPGDQPSRDILSVEVDGIPIDTVSTVMNVAYTHFAFTGTVTVVVTVREPIEHFDLSPHRNQIMAAVIDNTITFQLTTPQKLHLKINNLPRFFIFADTLESNSPKPGMPGVYDVSEYGVLSSIDTIQTKAIQQAINEVASKKGTLYFPPGIYRSGQLKMKSNLFIYISPGAVIKGTGDVSDYPNEEMGTQFFYLQNCQNIMIRGRGVIDGNGRSLRLTANNSSNSRLKLIRSLRAKNCIVEDVILRDSGTWAVHLIESDDLHIRNIKLISTTRLDDPTFPWELNTDGFDPDNSSHITMEDNFISCNDDAVAVKLKSSVRSEMSNIQFQNNIIWTVKSALKIGTEVHDHVIRGVVFENNAVIHADRGIVLYCYRGAVIEHPQWIGNYFETINDDMKRMNIHFKIADEGGKGHIHNVIIKDNIFEHFSPNTSELIGLDDTNTIDSVTFENLMIAGKQCKNSKDAQIDINAFVKNVSFQ